MDRRISLRTTLGSTVLRRLLVVAGLGLVSASNTAFALEPCGTGTYPFPYTDVGSVGDPFCPGIMEAYVTGVSRGTTPTTFSPNNTVTRVQMTTFLQRTVDQVLTRGSRRAALNQWWMPQAAKTMQTIPVGGQGQSCAADGENIWVASSGTVNQVQASTGKILGSWTAAPASGNVVVAVGKVFATGLSTPGALYVIDPTLSPRPVTVAASNLGNETRSIAFDGTSLWTANVATPGSVSIIDPESFSVNTVSTGLDEPWGILYDGAHIWVTDFGAGTLLQLDASGNILQTVTVGSQPAYPVFDGTNIWVPNFGSSSITVVQPSNPAKVVATISGDANNQLNQPIGATFDGERVLVTNYTGNSVTVFKAADLSLIANVTTGSSTSPSGACSDGINFWVLSYGTGNLLRF